MTREGIEKHLASLKEDYAKTLQAAQQAQMILGAIRMCEVLLKEADDALSIGKPEKTTLDETS